MHVGLTTAETDVGEEEAAIKLLKRAASVELAMMMEYEEFSDAYATSSPIGFDG